MDAHGLPIAFGKQQALPQKPEGSSSGSQTPAPQRGANAARGPRGAVGTGRKARGRGRGGGGVSSANGEEHTHTDTQLNEGVKRSFPASNQSLPPQSSFFPRGGNSGSRGRGGGRGGAQGGGADGEEASERGFFKESYCEDPWRDLIDQLERQRQAEAGK